MVHELKILPQWFNDVKDNGKNFEIRRLDRDFKVGDKIILREYVQGEYTGREIQREITYIYAGDGTYGLYSPFGVLGLKEVEA